MYLATYQIDSDNVFNLFCLFLGRPFDMRLFGFGPPTVDYIVQVGR